jgi:hypothetical protein
VKYVSVYVPPVAAEVGPVGVAWEGTLTYYTMVDPQRPMPQRVFGPKTADHSALRFALSCHTCGHRLKEGDMTTLLPMGPSGEDARARARERLPHRQIAVEIHVDCALEHHGDK